MSDFTPEKKKKNRRTPRVVASRWILFSLALHAAALALLFLSPAAPTASGASSARVEKAIAERREDEAKELEAVRSQVAQLEKIRGEMEKLEQPSQPPTPNSQPPKDLQSLYEKATEAETEIATSHKQIRARELAQISDIPVEQALKEMDAPQPVRPRLDLRALPDSDTSSGAAQKLEAQRAAQTARQEIRSMVAAAQKMLAQAKAQSGAKAGGKSGQGSGAKSTGAKVQLGQNLAGVGKETSRQKSLVAAVQAGAGKRVQDLTAIMKGGGSADPSRSKYAPTSEMLDETLADLDSREIRRDAIAGRTVGQGGAGASWMFADSWYTIGPFPNPSRSNLDRRFPPETIIDLDAEYSGKENRAVHWQFVQAGGPRVRPAAAEEYAVYYAYTELWFDAPRDLWIAVGGDDKATLWLNDDLVWISGDQLKGWRAGEALRKVHFKKGLNRVLFRIENGWKDVAFSLAIALREPSLG